MEQNQVLMVNCKSGESLPLMESHLEAHRGGKEHAIDSEEFAKRLSKGLKILRRCIQNVRVRKAKGFLRFSYVDEWMSEAIQRWSDSVNMNFGRSTEEDAGHGYS